jgi:anti-sigma factor RsiW
MTHAEITELLGAYALDAVSPEEAAAIEQHLAECPRCRAEVAAHREVAGVLGNLSGTAPAGLWNRIADELALGSEPPAVSDGRDLRSPPPPVLQSPPVLQFGVSPDALDGAGDRKPVAGGSDAIPAPVIAIRSARSRAVSSGHRGALERDRRRFALFSVAASVAVVLALVVGALSIKVVHLDDQVDALSHAVLNPGVRAQAAAAELEPGHVNVDLTSPHAAWSAEVVVVPGGEAFLLPGKMPALRTGQTYQAWALERDGTVRSLGVIGRSGAAMQLQAPMTAVLVNTEPEGGTTQPTTTPFLAGRLPKSF